MAKEEFPRSYNEEENTVLYYNTIGPNEVKPLSEWAKRSYSGGFSSKYTPIKVYSCIIFYIVIVVVHKKLQVGFIF